MQVTLNVVEGGRCRNDGPAGLSVSQTALQLLGFFFPYQCVYHERKCQVNSICPRADMKGGNGKAFHW